MDQRGMTTGGGVEKEICVWPGVSGRLERDRAPIFKVYGAAYKAKYLSGDLYPVAASPGALNDFSRNRRGDRPMINQHALVSGCIANVHPAGRVTLLHHDDAFSRAQRKLQIFGQT